uniref:Methyltransferase type 11 domain-containing protein n=1 Tax=Chromera velia CCMP2878 TaxID=1169474 RepID=A0A0G4G256_9ALVE|eukprot:Cvel_19814.t1-p1 / transcript=Cvel_19814.t1 / gene=Cvel_19814 / organism=Chromera_velia_CCMP2878 / gene_product=Sterol 24-C-methyltransferase, putative / transcript_product=Sterol 24-C-methyltransferase, putative / location=Cvel_scaffold1734:20125-21558(-) / protein_length=350 / sequence_SO=supercontig / SO=protein_coding / is_pseudo=false
MFQTLDFAWYRTTTVVKALHSLYNLTPEELDAFFNSYKIYEHDWENKDDLKREFGDEYAAAVGKRLGDYYKVLNHLCAIGEVEKMYIPPVMNAQESITTNQTLFEETMAKDLQVSEGARVLDIGCGRGRVANHMSSFLGARVTGFNVDPTQIEFAKRWTTKTQNPCDFKVHDMNVRPLPFEDETFDGIYQIQAFSLANDLADLFREIFRIMKPGGRIAFLDWAVFDSYDPNNEEHVELMRRVKPLIGAIGCPSPTQFETYLKDAGFKVLQSRNISEGGHQAPLIENARKLYHGVADWTKFFCKWRLMPSYFEKLLDRLNQDGEAFVKMDTDDLVTTSYYIVAQKPPAPSE